MKIDMHCHTSERSSCSGVPEAALIQAAIQSGLDGIVLTDHDRNAGDDHLKVLNRLHYPFKIFSGIEIREERTGEDVLVIGIPSSLWPKMKWSYEELLTFAKENNGYTILAHPYRWENKLCLPVMDLPPDAVELRSGNISKCLWDKIDALALSIGAKGVANSDAHSAETVGVYYTQFPHHIHSDRELVAALHSQELEIGVNLQKRAAINAATRRRKNHLQHLI